MGKTTIYYFTGTGNSLKVAKDIKERLEEVNLVRICEDTLVANEDLSERIGIIFPVYYYGLPIMLKDFVNKLTVSADTYIFTIATCGGSVGVAIKQLEELLVGKGLKLKAGFKIQMPDNFQILYGPPSENKQRQYFRRQEELMDEICDLVSRKEERKFLEGGRHLAKALGGTMYKIFNPKEKDKNFWTDGGCNGCSSCARLCPAKNIEMNSGKPVWLNQCQLCLGCMQWCPQKSIQYKKKTIKRDRYHHPQIKIHELYK